MLSLLIVAGIINGVYSSGCCGVHQVESTCDAEQTQDCVWLDADHPADAALIALTGTTEAKQKVCVTEDNKECLELMLSASTDDRTVCGAPPPALDPSLPNYVAPECTFEECENEAITYNVQFILDESGSVTKEAYKTSMDWVENIINNDINSRAKISIFSFSNYVNNIYSFGMVQNDDRYAVIQAVNNAKNNYQGTCTDTLQALETAITDWSGSNVPKKTDINIMILITDGVPTCSCPDQDRSQPGGCSTKVCSGKRAEALAQFLADWNIRVLTMGIGKFLVKKIDCLSSDEDTHKVDSYDISDLFELEEEMRVIFCPGDDDPNPGDWSKPPESASSEKPNKKKGSAGRAARKEKNANAGNEGTGEHHAAPTSKPEVEYEEYKQYENGNWIKGWEESAKWRDDVCQSVANGAYDYLYEDGDDDEEEFFVANNGILVYFNNFNNLFFVSVLCVAIFILCMLYKWCANRKYDGYQKLAESNDSTIKYGSTI